MPSVVDRVEAEVETAAIEAAVVTDCAPTVVDCVARAFDSVEAEIDTAAIEAAVVVDCVPSVVDSVEADVDTAFAKFETARIESELPEMSVLRLITLAEIEFEKKLNDSEIWLSEIEASDSAKAAAAGDVPRYDPILPGKTDAPKA